MISHLRKRTTAALVALALTALVSAPVPAHAAPPAPSAVSLPVTGVVTGGGTFNGVFNLTSFAVQNGQVVALGTVSGTVTTAAGEAASVLTNVAAPVQVGTTTCSILHLDLGPLALDVLGLHVDLSRIVLDITAQTGAGKLLGNLLCAVAGLLDNPGGLARLLNQILGILAGV
jgi:hypothetical protein